MLVRCPKCSASYDIDQDNLPKVSGNRAMGYGWRLRCHKCSNVWWLSKMDLIASTQPRKASHGIDNYSQGSSSRIANAHNRNTSSSKTKNHKTFYRDLLIVAFMCAAVAGGYMFCRDKMASYMLRKKLGSQVVLFRMP